MRLNLSQYLTINNRFTISVEGECNKSFGGCELDGSDHSCPGDNVWFALTDKAFQVFTGDVKEEDGQFFGLLKNTDKK